MRPRYDKSANAFKVAENIWKTITGYNLREDLEETLKLIKKEHFDKTILGRRRRSEVFEQSDDNDQFD